MKHELKVNQEPSVLQLMSSGGYPEPQHISAVEPIGDIVGARHHNPVVGSGESVGGSVGGLMGATDGALCDGSKVGAVDDVLRTRRRPRKGF